MALVYESAVGHPRPRISVCIPNYNGKDFIRSCIESVLAQNVGEVVEIIVHDDSSQDGSAQIVEDEYPQVKLIKAFSNSGFCVANNRMAAAARGDFLLLLNNDATLGTQALETLLSAAEEAYTPVVLTLPQYDWETEGLVDRGCQLDPLFTPIRNTATGPADLAYVIGACLWTPRAVWNDIGGFPEWFESIGEDLYFCLTARLRGIPIRCVEGSGYWHRQGASFGGNRLENGSCRPATRYRRRYLSERNRIACLTICTPTFVVWPWLCVHLFALICEGMVLALIERNFSIFRRIYLAAIVDAWKSRAEIHATRTLAQANRKISLAQYLKVFKPKPEKVRVALKNGFPKISD